MIELRRGAIVLFAERGEYTGKLRPGIIVQRGSTLAEAPSITLCGLTSEPMPSHAARVPVVPSASNGLDHLSYAMVDKVASISRKRVRSVVGQLEEEYLDRVSSALRLWLDL